jgi:hypothetical protein
MAALSLSVDVYRPLNRWDHDSIRPGVVGSVGDCLLVERLKSSLPGEFRYERSGYGTRESDKGSNVQNGALQNHFGSAGPYVKDSAWGGRRRFKTRHGYIFQNIQPEDRMINTEMASTGRWDWNDQIAQVNHSNTESRLFAMPAGVNGPTNGLTRGGNFPRITDIVEESGMPMYQPNFKPGDSTQSFSAQEPVGLGNFRSGYSRAYAKGVRRR